MFSFALKINDVRQLMLEKDVNIARLQEELRMKSEVKLTNNPLWTLVVLMIEEQVMLVVLLLPGKWYKYSEDEGSFCQLLMGWLGYKNTLPKGYESWQHSFVKVREYVNKAMANSRNRCRLRLRYRRKCD